MAEQRAPGIVIDQIFLLKAEFDHRSDYLTLAPGIQHEELGVEVQAKMMAKEDRSAVVFSVAVRTDPEDAKALYRFNVELIALMRAIPGEENVLPTEFAAGAGVSTLFPFVRETVANLTMRGRFGPIWLKPINIRILADGLAAQVGKAADEGVLSQKT